MRRPPRLSFALVLAAAACAGRGPSPSGEYAPGHFRFVPDSAGPGRGRGCGWETSEGFDVVPLEAAPGAAGALSDSAAAYAAGLAARLDDFLSGVDTGRVHHAVAELSVTAGGSAEGLRLVTSSGDTSVDSNLLEHLHNAELVRVVRPLPIGLDRMRLAVGYGRRALSGEEHLVRAHVCPAAPRGPPLMGDWEGLRRLGEATGLGGRTATVLTQFVVDTTGRAAMATVRILRTPHPALEPAAREVLSKSAYRPAERDGRKVPQLVQQPLGFGFP